LVNLGALSLPLLQKYGDLSVVIQDRESVIAQAAEHWKTNLPIAIEDERVVFQVADFFQPNIIHGAEVYMLQYIIGMTMLVSRFCPQSKVIRYVQILDQINHFLQRR
jgi:hypothetical protein